MPDGSWSAARPAVDPDPSVPTALSGRPASRPVGRGFIALYTLAYASSCLMLIAPLLVTLALKVNSLVGIDRAPGNLSLVAGVGSLVALVGNPLLGRLSDRTTSPFGMRRPWMVAGLAGGTLGILVVAVAPSIPVVLVGWCLAQLCFNALLAAMVAVLPDKVPTVQRGLVAGVLGICVPVASVSGTYLVDLFSGSQLAMFLVPCALGGFFILLFVARLDDRRLPAGDKPPWSRRELAATFYVNPRVSPDFAWAFASRFLLVLAFAFLTTYQAYYLLDRLGSAEDDVPRQIFLGTLTQSGSSWLPPSSRAGSPTGSGDGRLRRRCVRRVRPGTAGDRRRRQLRGLPRRHGHQRARLRRLHGRRPRTRRRRAAGRRTPPPRTSACSTSRVPCRSPSRRPSRPPCWRVGGGSYVLLYVVAGACAFAGAAAILPVKQVR